MDDEKSVYLPDYLNEVSEMDDGSVYVPDYLNEAADEYGISLAAVVGGSGDGSGGSCTALGEGGTSCGTLLDCGTVLACGQCGQCGQSGYCGSTMEDIYGCCEDYSLMYCGTSQAPPPCTECTNNECTAMLGSTCRAVLGCTSAECTNSECTTGECTSNEDTGGGDDGDDDDETTTASLIIHQNSITSKSVTVTVYTDSDYAYYRIFCRLYDDESDTSYDADFNYVAGSFTCTITGLEPDSHYILNLGVYNGLHFLPSDLWVYSGDNPTFWTDPEGDFAWTYAGLDSSGQPILGNKKQAGLGIYVTADEWNELIGTINDKCTEGLGTVLGGGTTKISAAIVNQAARALGVDEVLSYSTPITAKFFNDLMDAVNAL